MIVNGKETEGLSRTCLFNRHANCANKRKLCKCQCHETLKDFADSIVEGFND